MRWLDVAWLYGLVGVACALASLRRDGTRSPRAIANAALNVLVWPLWAPLTLGEHATPPTTLGASEATRAAMDPRVADAVARIHTALCEAVETARSSPLARVLPASAVERVLGEVARVAARHTALSSMLNAREHDPQFAAERVDALTARADNPRALATARLHAENVTRLARLRDRDLRALEELAELAAALRTQLVLARFAGTNVDGASDIVGEVWARVEGLGEALDATGATESAT